MDRSRRYLHELRENDIRPVAQQIAAVLEEHRRAGFQRLRACGEILASAYAAIGERVPDRVPVMDDDQFVADVARVLRVPAAEVRTWWQVVERWPPAELEALAQHPRVTSSHLMAIAPVADEGWRQDKIQQVLRDGLSLEKLQRAAKQKMKPREPRRRRDNDPRPIISNAEVGLNKLQTEVECLINMVDNVLFPEGSGIPELLLADSPSRKNRTAISGNVTQSVEMIANLRQKLEASMLALQAAEAQLTNGADGGTR